MFWSVVFVTPLSEAGPLVLIGFVNRRTEVRGLRLIVCAIALLRRFPW
jgi:hypothetical protein